MDLKENIRQYIAQNMLFSDSFPHSDDASFLEEGIIDSIGFMELVTYVQQTFNIEVGPEELVPANFDLRTGFHRRTAGIQTQNHRRLAATVADGFQLNQVVGPSEQP